MTITVTKTERGRPVKHEVDPTQVDSLDEISGDEQLALVWCLTHHEWEWHWIDREKL